MATSSASSGLAGCQQAKADGTPCRGKARPGSGFCVFHDPAVAAKRAEGRKAGGRKRSRPAAVLPTDAADVPLTCVRDVVTLLGDTVNRVRKGELDAKVGNCLGVLSGVLLRALEEGDLAEQIRELRASIESLQHGDCIPSVGIEEAATAACGEAVGAESAAGEAAGRPGVDPLESGSSARRMASGPAQGFAPSNLTPLFKTVG
jgi:hypothetical protein